MKPISYRGIHSVFFATNNMEETIKFYRDLLGFRLIITQGDPNNQFKLYLFEVNETLTIAFFQWQDVQKMPFKQPGAPVNGPWGFDHFMIGVETEDDLFQLRDKFLMAGIDVSDVVDHGFVYSFYIHDPNNISLEFSYWVYPQIMGMPMFIDPAPVPSAEDGSSPQKGVWPDEIDPTPRTVLPGAGWNLIPEEMKNAETKVILPDEFKES